MSSTDRDKVPSQSGLVGRVQILREDLQQVSSDLLAERTGSSFQTQGAGKGEFRLAVFDTPVIVTYPGFLGVGEDDGEFPIPYQAVLAYYFTTSDGTPMAGEWISFAQLPDGRTYNQAFQGYTGDELVKYFGMDLHAFKAACQKNGGAEAMLGDAAFVFYALPRLPLLVNYWCGDEDFPSTCKILFDRSVSHYLPTDVCAIVGSMLTRRLVKSRLRSAR